MRLPSLLLFTLVLGSGAGNPSLTRQIEETFGEVSWNPNVRTTYCSDCTEVEIKSFGGAFKHQAARLGNFAIAGSIWGDTVPVFMNANGKYLTADPSSYQPLERLKWSVADNVEGIIPGIWNGYYIDGFNCPWDLRDHWDYEWEGGWHSDPTIKVSCVSYRKKEQNAYP